MKHKKLLKFICLTLMMIFLGAYLIEMSGYYEYNLQTRKNLTTEQMKQFEKDIQEGKEVDLESYLESTTVDYSNKLTRTTSEVSIQVNQYLKEFLTKGFKMFEKFVK